MENGGCKDDGTVEQPINREPQMQQLISSFLTNTGNYDRNHGPIAHICAETHFVTIDGMVTRPRRLSARDLATNFAQHSVTCALQCAGNRRHSMRTRLKEVQGIDWSDGAVMNCKWEGPRLRDVLLAAGIKCHGDDGEELLRWKGLHVQFACLQTKCQHDEWFGASIPLERGMRKDMDVILALKMNGNPLPQKHGFPIRVIVPGALGARSVKWLDRVTVADQESPSFYQQRDYKILPPEADSCETAKDYWDKVPAMLDMPINACVAIPASNSMVQLTNDGTVQVQGYAVPEGSSGPVVRVQVSGDEGKTWIDAEIDSGGRHRSKWSWVLWKAKIRIQQGQGRRIFAKATDAGGNVQRQERSEWNLRGVAYNGYEAVIGLNVLSPANSLNGDDARNGTK